MKKLTPKFKLWFNTDTAEGVFGDGKWRLLKAIESTGSLRAASESLHISYRKAWGDLQKAQTSLDTLLIEKHRGGSTGGGTGLTEQGKQWLKAYEKFRADAEKTIQQKFDKHFGKISG